MMNRKAVAFDFYIFMFFRIMVLFTVAIAMVFFVSQFTRVSIDVNRAEAEIFAQGLMHSPNGISHLDEATGRVMPGFIDAEGFMGAQDRINKAFYYEENRFIAAKISLLDVGDIYYNREFYDIWHPLAETGFLGRGGAMLVKKTYPVKIMEGGQLNEGMLELTIVLPNS
jgi:hypothetical protein